MSTNPTLKDSLLAKQNVLMQKAKLMLDTAEKASRGLTEDEEKVHTALLAEIDGITTRLEGQDSNDALDAAINKLLGTQADGRAVHISRSAPRASLGKLFTENEAVREFFKAGGHRHAQWTSPAVEMQATLLDESAGSGGALIIPDNRGLVAPLILPTPVARLIAPGETSSNLVEYQRGTFTNNAAAVAEGTAKPESALVFEPVSDPVRKIAHWIPVTEEFLEDAEAARSIIDREMLYGLDLAENDQLINGDGLGANITGFLARVGLAADVPRGASETNADAVFNQIFAIWTATGLMPTGIVMHPNNWKTCAAMKNTLGENLGTGPFDAPQTPVLWGLPVALTVAIAAGTCLVGAFGTMAQLFRRGGTRVEASNSHASFFIENKVAIRAERREALCVMRPQAFGTCSALN